MVWPLFKACLNPCSSPFFNPKSSSFADRQATVSRTSELQFSCIYFLTMTFYLWQVKLAFPI